MFSLITQCYVCSWEDFYDDKTIDFDRPYIERRLELSSKSSASTFYVFSIYKTERELPEGSSLFMCAPLHLFVQRGAPSLPKSASCLVLLSFA